MERLIINIPNAKSILIKQILKVLVVTMQQKINHNPWHIERNYLRFLFGVRKI